MLQSVRARAAAVMTGCTASPEQATAKAAATTPPAAAPSAPPLAQDLYAVMKEKGPVLTTGPTALTPITTAKPEASR